MRAFAAFLAILVSAVVLSGCGDSATEITGTLPIVTGIAIDTLGSNGDTIVVTWDSLTVNVEGYLVWYRVKPTDNWTLVDAVTGNIAAHLADRSAYYTVMAFNGDDTSMDIGLADNTMPEDFQEYIQPVGPAARGFRIIAETDSIVHGDPSDPDFHQQFTVAFSGLGAERYIYPGRAHQEMWPGGEKTFVSDIGGFLAPAPGDSVLWRDSIPFGEDFFLALESGHYCRLANEILIPDSLGTSDTLIIGGQYQPLQNVRVFRQTW